jgi:hypothetical protein
LGVNFFNAGGATLIMKNTAKFQLNHFLLYAFMNILNYKLDTTNELLTSHIGLITPAHTIQVLDLSKTIDQHFPATD